MKKNRSAQPPITAANSPALVEIYPHAMLRTPIRSYQRFVALRDDAEPRQTVLALYREPVIRRALRAKSRSLCASLERHEQAGTPIDDDTFSALYRYYARLTTRCTPLMLFAGVGAAQVGAFDGVRQAPADEWRLGIFPSWRGILKTARVLLEDRDVRSVARFRFTETALPRGGVICYFTAEEPEGVENLSPLYKVVSMRRDVQLRPLLAALSRWWRWDELVHVIISQRPNTTPELAEEYLLSMIDGGVLIHSLQPSSIGPRPERQLHDVAAGEPVLGELFAQCQALLQFTDTPLPIADSSFDAAWAALERHPWVAEVSSPDGSSASARGGTIGQAVLRIDAKSGGIPLEPVRQLGELVHRTPWLWGHRFEAYRQAITSYFAEGTIGRRIPLLELVYRIAKGPNLRDMLPAARPVEPARDRPQRFPGSYFSNKFLDADLARQEQIDLDVADFNQARESAGVSVWPRLPRFIESTFRCVHHKGRAALVHQSSTSFVGSMVNRFLHWDDKDPILLQLREIWRLEEQRAAPALMAEITCGGAGRVVDLSQRPRTYAYQVVVQGQPSVDEEHQIHLTDLSVFMGPRGPVLWWEKRGVPIIARQLSALSIHVLPVVVHVLSALEDQPSDWLLHLDEDALPVHTPRLCAGDVILRPQSWLLPPSLQSALKRPAQKRNETELRALLHKWRERYEVPRWVRLGSADHNAVDLESPIALLELEGMVRDGMSRVQEEFLEAGSPVVGDDGPLVAEAVTHLTLPDSSLEAALPQVTTSQLERAELRQQHVFPPGSPWLFLKLYYGAGLASHPPTSQFLHDNLIGRFVAPLIFELEKAGQLANFHFVRYADPEVHLRLRLQPKEGSSLELLEQICSRLDQEARDGGFDRWQVATFQREVDRYGGPELIAEAERLFTADSRLCLRILSAYHRDAIEEETELQLLLPIRTLNTLYRAFGFDLVGRLECFSKLREQYERGRAPSPEKRRVLDGKYRRVSATVQRLLLDLEANTRGQESSASRKKIDAWFKSYEQSLSASVIAYKTAAQRGLLSTPLDDILSSFFHMHCNRLLGSNDLEAEIIHMSQRAVEAVIARLKKSPDLL